MQSIQRLPNAECPGRARAHFRVLGRTVAKHWHGTALYEELRVQAIEVCAPGRACSGQWVRGAGERQETADAHAVNGRGQKGRTAEKDAKVGFTHLCVVTHAYLR